MALATQCPHCHTTFRVAQDQLKLRAGLVRCGACKQVFNGIAHLLPPTDETQAAAPPSTASALPASEVPAEERPEITQAPSTGAHDQAATETGTADTEAVDTPVSGESAQTRPDEAKPDPLQRMTLLDFVDARREAGDSTSGETADEQEADAPDTPDPLHHVMDELEQKPRRNPGKPSSQDEADDIDDGLDDEYEEPSFIRQGRRRQRYGRAARIVMSVGSVVLLLTLAAQAVFVFRDQIAARMPQMKPMLAEACALLRCRVDLPAQIEAVSIESSELQTLSPERNTFVLTTLLRNHGAIPQAWPSIELTLNDANEKPIARRVFMPRDYLASPQDVNKGFAARSEQSIKLSFELSQLKASGYRVYLFYP